MLGLYFDLFFEPLILHHIWYWLILYFLEELSRHSAEGSKRLLILYFSDGIMGAFSDEPVRLWFGRV